MRGGQVVKAVSLVMSGLHARQEGPPAGPPTAASGC